MKKVIVKRFKHMGSGAPLKYGSAEYTTKQAEAARDREGHMPKVA